MRENEFFDDLQDFARFFLSIEKDCNPKNIKAKKFYDLGNYGKKAEFFKFADVFKPKKYKKRRRFKNFKHWEWKKFVRDVYFSEDKANLWILKPSGLSRGRGLEIFNSLEDLSRYLLEYWTGFSEKEYQDQDCEDEEIEEEDEEDEEDDEDLDGGGEDEEKNNEEETIKQSKDIENENLKENSYKKKSNENLKENSYKKKSNKNQISNKNKKRLKSHYFIIQKYMERPLLIKGKKCDIRAYALVNHEMKLFVFK